MPKRALITGIAGQDGYYLTELLLSEGYEVFGLVLPTDPVDILEPYLERVAILPGDLTDDESVRAAVETSRPDEVYNFAAQSSVAMSWERPVLTAEVDAVGPLRLLEAVRKLAPVARVLQPSSADMFGCVEAGAQDESTPFRPVSPYGAAKLFAHVIGVDYRQTHGTFVCNAILFNHESPKRPVSFVTRKITEGAARVKLGLAAELPMGNLDVRRDWGLAGDYVRAMWLMLRHERPDDYVVATGETHTVRDFCEIAFAHLGLDYREYVTQDERFMRPADSIAQRGDAGKARRVLGWVPTVSFRELVEMMVDADVARLKAGPE